MQRPYGLGGVVANVHYFYVTKMQNAAFKLLLCGRKFIAQGLKERAADIAVGFNRRTKQHPLK
jgi:hypothetical protein